jgi:hypothetical protein
MADLVRFVLPSGASVAVQADPPPGVTRVGRGVDGILESAIPFDKVMAQIREVADTALEQLRNSVSRPSEIEIEFRVALGAQAGAIIAKTSLDAHLQVKVCWKHTTD